MHKIGCAINHNSRISLVHGTFRHMRVMMKVLHFHSMKSERVSGGLTSQSTYNRLLRGLKSLVNKLTGVSE